jgi:hypothetical protein
MITKEQRLEAMKGVLASLFASQRTLKSLAPNFKWAGLGNLLGDYGEFIAIEDAFLPETLPLVETAAGRRGKLGRRYARLGHKRKSTSVRRLVRLLAQSRHRD